MILVNNYKEFYKGLYAKQIDEGGINDTINRFY